jgi:hypothetical protein
MWSARGRAGGLLLLRKRWRAAGTPAMIGRQPRTGTWMTTVRVRRPAGGGPRRQSLTIGIIICSPSSSNATRERWTNRRLVGRGMTRWMRMNDNDVKQVNRANVHEDHQMNDEMKKNDDHDDGQDDDGHVEVERMRMRILRDNEHDAHLITPRLSVQHQLF